MPRSKISRFRLTTAPTLLLLSLGLSGCGSSRQTATALPNTLAAGVVSATTNPLVATYSLTPPLPGQMYVEFGLDTTYGFATSTKPVLSNGVPAVIQVAGMRQNTTYHMRASFRLNDGTLLQDVDHTFTSGQLPANSLPAFTTQITPAATPQPGVELLDPVLSETSVGTSAFVTDLLGNVIWDYPFPDRQSGVLIYPVRPLPNGNFGMMIAPVSESVASTPFIPVPPGALNVLREVDLIGNTIRQLTMTDLNTRMAAAGFNVTLQLFSHDFRYLKNGHWLVIANTVKTFTDLPGYPGALSVAGDVVVDLDPNFNPVWYWNEFDHFDINRHPYLFPDWTHTNSITYSPTDGNFIVSIRHQNWVVKVDYRDGAGSGDIVWKLGEGGDFTLKNGVDPTDWFYAQHNAVFASPQTAGSFTMALMDNGNDRIFPASVTCGSAGAPVCQYTTVPVMQVDENAKTATLQFHQVLPPALYSSFAGNAEVLDNGNVEYDLAGVGSDSYIYEETQQANPLVVWQLHLLNANDYRGFRIPSLYPGVQW